MIRQDEAKQIIYERVYLGLKELVTDESAYRERVSEFMKIFAYRGDIKKYLYKARDYLMCGTDYEVKNEEVFSECVDEIIDNLLKTVEKPASAGVEDLIKKTMISWDKL